MIVCPNCNHQNPDGAVQCEACYTPLPAMSTCPNCGATVQMDASFCGQCGFSLRSAGAGQGVESPPLVSVSPVPVPPPPAPAARPNSIPSFDPPPFPATSQPIVEGEDDIPIQYRTQIQQQTARLLHVQTSTAIELPQGLNLIHLGKPNDRIPADIDLSGFPNSEIVSRIHADIRVEGDAYYLEDVGSSNGTYVNNAVLPSGNRHRLRPGDRIALGKGDKMTFLFQLA